MAAILPEAREAIAYARAGDLPRAIAAGEAAAALSPADGGLRLFVGMLHMRQDDPARAVSHLEAAADLVTDSPMARLELARALTGLGRLDEAEAALASVAGEGGAGAELLRIRGMISQQRGDHADAARIFSLAVTQDARDFESWGRLGVSRLAIGDAAGAEDAFSAALARNPGLQWVRMKCAEAAVGAGRGEAALAAAQAAAAQAASGDADPMLIVARLEELLDRPEAAEASLNAALERDGASVPALIALAALAERDNRIADCTALVRRAKAAGARAADTAITEARLALREGDCAAVMALLRDDSGAIDPVMRAELIGRCRDRAGDPETAFQAFDEMNRQIAMQSADWRGAARSFRDRIAARHASATAQWAAGWAPFVPSDGRRDPVFMFGFPRSGTTLVDTFLMGHPGVAVMEEQPAIQAALDVAGGIVDDAGALDPETLSAMRAAYFRAADALAPGHAGRLLIDKVPLGATETALIHRLFPDARYIFVERHPCDVVLSCFMTAFDPRGGMANFLSLDDAARLYDALCDYWVHCRALFALPACNTRYERLIADPEAELRGISDFLGLDFRAGMLDHRETAVARSHIPTPSYAQVSAPLHSKAAGRWLRYRSALAPVLPILRPWAARMGYAMA